MKFSFPPTEPFPGVSSTDWHDWRWQFRSGLRSREDLSKHLQLSEDEAAAFDKSPQFPVAATPYYIALVNRENPEDPIRRMVIPRLKELNRGGQHMPDPLGEEKHSPVKRLVHRYPDRVLFLLTDQCSLYCRYCLRKHFTGMDQAFIGSSDYDLALDYIRRHPRVREVILSGGDPLTLGDSRIERVLFDLRKIETVEVIRIASRMPVVCPMRLTNDLVGLFKKHKPVFFITHFNHPRELSAEAAGALELLVDNGVPVFNQMVLLNGINNHAAIVKALSRRLLYLRVKPYYMFQCDPSEGTEHFRTSVDESLRIQRELWGSLSGLAMPNLSLDIPGGGGKVGLVPDFEIGRGEGYRDYRGFDGIVGRYENPIGPSIVPPDVEIYANEP